MQIPTTLILYITFINDPKWKTKQRQAAANAQKHKEDFNIEKYGRTFPRVAGDGWRVKNIYEIKYVVVCKM